MPLVSYSSSYDYGPCLCYRCRYTGLALVVLNTGLTPVIVAVAGLALALVAGAAAAVHDDYDDGDDDADDKQR